MNNDLILDFSNGFQFQALCNSINSPMKIDTNLFSHIGDYQCFRSIRTVLLSRVAHLVCVYKQFSDDPYNDRERYESGRWNKLRTLKFQHVAAFSDIDQIIGSWSYDQDETYRQYDPDCEFISPSFCYSPRNLEERIWLNSDLYYMAIYELVDRMNYMFHTYPHSGHFYQIDDSNRVIHVKSFYSPERQGSNFHALTRVVKFTSDGHVKSVKYWAGLQTHQLLNYEETFGYTVSVVQQFDDIELGDFEGNLKRALFSHYRRVVLPLLSIIKRS